MKLVFNGQEQSAVKTRFHKSGVRQRFKSKGVQVRSRGHLIINGVATREVLTQAPVERELYQDSDPRNEESQQLVDKRGEGGLELLNFVVGTKLLAGDLLNNIQVWKNGFKNSTLAKVDSATQDSQLPQQVSQKTKEPSKDIFKYLQPICTEEVKHARRVSRLADLVYEPDKLTDKKLKRLVDMELVTTSRTFSSNLDGWSESIQDTILEGDGMSCSIQSVAAAIPSLPDTALDQDVSANSPEFESPFESPFESKHVQQETPSSTKQLILSAQMTMNFVSNAIAQRFLNDHKQKTQTSKSTSNQKRKKPKNSKKKINLQDWFVCDDQETRTRFFVIQGSTSVGSWQTNLTFDPVVFEDVSLGVKIHRGVYKVAEELYWLFLPLVEEHFARHPYGKLSFTGHSLGGALATALMFMFRYRKKIPITAFAPTYTFGGAASFCEGALIGGCGSCCTSCPIKEAPGFEESQKMSLIQRLGFSVNSVRNVVMTHDIVPRAFACDYSLVADFMKSWGQSFREHDCLSGESRKSLYSLPGQILVLQPPKELKWVNGEGYHAMFPNYPDLFLLSDKSNMLSEVLMLSKKKSAIREGKVFGKEVESVQEATMQFMDTPHPLDVLSDPKAYGAEGRISRYHNPSHYTKGIAGVCKDRVSNLALLKKPAIKSSFQKYPFCNFQTSRFKNPNKLSKRKGNVNIVDENSRLQYKRYMRYMRYRQRSNLGTIY
eukprot:TRINITY_DN2632_c0_g1_i6.p1 TRINITY_DN2632_c0_g1~~TRINITY_DN2632_c0_g1_i6.p1  ORF type:complete len:718 (-),score=73.40 TRINITY_DN2632_c0_g1_i6:1354-3507(-)